MREVYFDLTADEKVAAWASLISFFMINPVSEDSFGRYAVLFTFIFLLYQEVKEIHFSKLENECLLSANQATNAKIPFATLQVEFWDKLIQIFQQTKLSTLYFKCGRSYFSLSGIQNNSDLRVNIAAIPKPFFFFAFDGTMLKRLWTWIYERI